MSSARNYNFLDRALHHLAFASGSSVQRVLGELENDLYSRELAAVTSQNELFVTGLPRAGTTLILELLFGTGEFATFTYRNMPFVLAPLLWDRMSKSFRKRGERMQRAHGDGVEISFDSPEAFEEVIWLSYLRSRIVHADRLVPLSPDALTPEFSEAMRNTVRKLLRLAERRDGARAAKRYLSKNNANISRVAAIAELFPTATILIAFREPFAQVGSLMRQHRRFVEEHATDKFSRRYMEWIGHYEFGENLKPIDFGGWLGPEPAPAVPDETFWMKYWNAAYRHAIEHRRDNVHFVDFDALLRGGRRGLEVLADVAGVRARERFLGAADILRAPTSMPAAADACNPMVRDVVATTYNRLKTLAIR